ncbi:MAG: ABC transporter ATP-binding protein [Betaproteobacteria bacterium]|nr:ABC transporter ATP-binding protein [Betaproteobacteria bacterium]
MQAAASSTALRLAEVRKMFLTRNGQVVNALAGVSLEVGRSEVVAVLGPSGCGKSTLLRVLAGLDDAYNGTINSDRAAGADARTTERLQSATVFQTDSTLPWMTVEQNLRVGLAGLSIDRATQKERIDRYLGLVGLADFRNAYPHELSGGMRQRVAIARALASEPLLLLMDEPLAALDAQTRLVMQQELLAIWAVTRSTVVYVTHDIAEALALADRVVVMSARPGRIKSVHDVPFPRDRDVIEMRRHPAFRELEVALWKSVAEEVGSSLGAPAKPAASTIGVRIDDIARSV